MELSSIVPAPPPPPLPPQLSPSFQPPLPPQVQPPAATSTSTPPTPTPASTSPTPPVPGGDQPLAQPRTDTTQTPLQQALVQPPAPRFQQGNQPGPWPQAFPASPVFTSPDQYPPLPGETPDETQHLNAFAWREAPKGNVMNDIAAKDPTQYGQGHTDQGYWQIVNTTWQDGAAKAGVDLRQYPTAMTAPYRVQRQVALALYRAYGDKPWASSAGAGEKGDKFQLASQKTILPPERRDFQDWGHPPPVSGSMPDAQPPESEWARVLNTVSPLLLAIGSIALRLPLSSAITAYGAMSRAQYNGQKDEYERNRTHFQDKFNESNAQQALESKDASDAFDSYGHNNPQGLQQRLMQIALTYNDPILYGMAAKGDLNGAYKLQADRDLHNQSLTKVNDAVRKQQEQEAIDADVAARDRKWRQENPNASPDDFAIAHNQHIGEANRAGSKDPKAEGAGEEAKVYNVVDKETGKPTGKQVRVGKNGGTFDLDGKPTTLAPNEKLGDEAGVKATQDKPEQEGEVKNVLGADGKRTGQQVREGKQGGYFDPNTKEPVQLKPGETIETKDPTGDKLSEPKFYDVVKDGKVQRTVQLRDRKSGPGFEYAQTGEPFQTGPGEELMPHAERAATGPRFGTIDDLMNRWHEQFVKDNNREPSTDEISKQRQTFTQETKPPAASSRQVSQRLGIAIGEAAGGIDALSKLSSHATLGIWGGAQAALSTNSYENFVKSLANKVTPREARMLNSIASVIARPLASVEAAGVATGLVGVTDSLRREFPQQNDDGYTVLTKMANLRNIIDAAADQLVVDKTIAPEIREQIAKHRDQVDAAIPYTLNDVVNAEADPTKENIRGLAERLLHRQPTSSGLPPGVTVEVH